MRILFSCVLHEKERKVKGNLTLTISISERRHSGFPHFAGRICHSYSQVALRIYHQEGHCLLGYLYNRNKEMSTQ